MDIDSVSTTPYWINETTPLFVVQHKPASANINKTAVIILNSGFLHNVGPYRLSSNLANRMSSQGFVAARLDQSGKGDSPPRRDLAGKEARLLDFDEIFEHLRVDFGVSDCILVGLCSGADDALEIAEVRESVSGLIFLDGFSPVTLSYYANHYFKRLRYFRSWLQWKRRIQRKKQRDLDLQKSSLSSSVSNSGSASVISLRRWRSEKEVKRTYESVLKRGVKIFAVFSGGAGDYYNHCGQLARGLNVPTTALEEVYFHEASHIYSQPNHRDRLVEAIGNWVQRQF